MSQDIVKAMGDLTSNFSFSRNRGRSGGSSGGRSTGSTTGRATKASMGQMGSAVEVANTIAGSTGNSINQNPRDPQGVWGRPNRHQGDAYSGNRTYGGPAGR